MKNDDAKEGFISQLTGGKKASINSFLGDERFAPSALRQTGERMNKAIATTTLFIENGTLKFVRLKQ